MLCTGRDGDLYTSSDRLSGVTPGLLERSGADTGPADQGLCVLASGKLPQGRPARPGCCRSRARRA